MEATNATIEEWRPVAGYEGLYEVSSMGRVRSWHRMGGPYATWQPAETPRVLKPGLGGDGYLLVVLADRDGKHRSVKVHRLVAVAFVGTAPLGKEVHHRDGNKQHNYATNLEYVTRSENTLHAYRTGLCVKRTRAYRRAMEVANAN